MAILFLLFLFVSLKTALAATDAERLCVLEKKMDVLEPVGIKSALTLNDADRIAALEKRMEALELLCTARCGLERHCLVPSVQNGQARCPEKMPPGSKCSVVCDPGYIATPGMDTTSWMDTTSCKKDGFWTRDMQCEIPLVVVSGGYVDQGTSGDSSVEVLSLYPSTGCDINIPNMPLADGSHRSLHNLLYLPMRNRMMACNGMTSSAESTCDIWDVKNKKWKSHTYPHKDSASIESYCSYSFTDDNSLCKNGVREKGRYASEALYVGGNAYILGGMLYDKKGHEPTSSVRELHETQGTDKYDKEYWHDRKGKMKQKRAFFCTAKVKDGGILAIGGLGRNETGNTVEKSMEYKSIGWNGLPDISKLSDMTIPRSGHSCTEVAGRNFTVIVSGGTMGFGQPAMASAEMFDWNSNSWKNVASMNDARFGHAVVAVGGKIFAIGGDDRNPSNILATIEEYDLNRNSWKIIETKLKKPRSQFGVTLVPHSIFSGCDVSDPLRE